MVNADSIAKEIIMNWKQAQNPMPPKSTFSTVVSWIDTGINWIKKGLRRGQVNNIDSAINGHDVKRVNDIMRGIEEARRKRTNAS